MQGRALLGLPLFLIAVTSSEVVTADPKDFYSFDYYTDVTGGFTTTVNMDKALDTGNRLRAGGAYMDAESPYLDKGYSINVGYGGDTSKPFHFDTDWTYWRFPGKISGNGLDVLIVNNSLTWNVGSWSVRLKPIARNRRFVNAPNETIVASLGIGYGATFYSKGAWSFSIGGEESNYYGNHTVMQTIFSTIRTTGGAPFVSSLVISRLYAETSYMAGPNLFRLGYDYSKVVVTPNKYLKSVYLDYDRELSSRWSMRTSVGTGSLDGSDWFASIGATYTP